MNAILKVLVVAQLLVLGWIGVVYASTQQVAGEIRVQRIVLVDAEGNVRGVWEPGALKIIDSVKQTRVELLDDAESSEVAVYCPKHLAPGRASIGATNAAYFTAWSKADNAPACHIGTLPNGKAYVWTSPR